MAETQKLHPEIGSQRAFNYFVTTHPNNERGPGRHRAQERPRHRASREKSVAPNSHQETSETKERRGWRQRAATLRALGGKAMDFGLNVYARASIPKSVRKHTGAILAEHEKAAQAAHGDAREYFVPSQEVGDRAMQNRILRTGVLDPESVHGLRAAEEDGGKDELVDQVIAHGEALKTDGDVLVDPTVSPEDLDLPAPFTEADLAAIEVAEREAADKGVSKYADRRAYRGRHQSEPDDVPEHATIFPAVTPALLEYRRRSAVRPHRRGGHRFGHSPRSVLLQRAHTASHR